MANERPAGPGDVWDMIRRADDLVKYAPNRDRDTARAQARDQLQRAAAAAEALEDRKAGDALAEQVRIRLSDLENA
ncbi:MAG: hypothetical protein ACRDH8_14705 [Actinomycetota bacterium]|jgi:hypothetical protein